MLREENEKVTKQHKSKQTKAKHTAVVLFKKEMLIQLQYASNSVDEKRVLMKQQQQEQQEKDPQQQQEKDTTQTEKTKTRINSSTCSQMLLLHLYKRFL